jgi:succinate dehydrogenase/fumarate reductase flavoprotein subunit
VLIEKDGRSFSVRARRGIVLATGGFGANAEMLRRYAPELSALQHDSTPGATGDGHRLAERAGADLVNMQFVEIVPGGPVSIPYVIRLDIYPDRMVMVNARGERFVDERSDRKTLGEAILAQPGGIAYTITDNETVSSSDILDQKYLHQARHAGVVVRARNWAELAEKLSVPRHALERTLARACAGRTGQTSEGPCRRIVRRAPFWAQKIELHIHVTLGGVRINSKAQVLDKNGVPISGLYAAGEIVGNLHGAVRLGGNGVSSAVVFGRIAGENI